MPRREVDLVNGEVYHICYRAVGDSFIFRSNDDYYRGIFSLYEFNNDNPVQMWVRRKERKKEKLLALNQLDKPILSSRDFFVETWAFCFMPNHIHLLLRQLKEGGISSFMRKIGGGYANYFNRKYQRKGHLFNQFKAIHIKTDNQLKNVLIYIHCNPLSLIQPNWKDVGIIDSKKALKFLENKYRWSSFWDYLGKSNFPSVTSREFLLELVGSFEGIKEEVNNWISYKTKLKKVVKDNMLIFIEQ